MLNRGREHAHGRHHPQVFFLAKLKTINHTQIMKIPYTALIAATLLLPLNAQDAASASPAPAPAADEAEYAKYRDLMREDLATMEQFLKVLQGVHDKQSADAAVPQAKELWEKLDKPMLDPSEAIQARLDAEFARQRQRLESDSIIIMGPIITQGCYGSQALKEVLAPLLPEEIASVMEEAVATQPDAQPAELSAEEQADYAKHREYAQMSIHAIIELSELVKEVNSKESADAAALKVKEIVERMEKQKAAHLDDTKPTDAVLARLNDEFLPMLKFSMGQMHSVLVPLEMNQWYGSDALKEEMGHLLDKKGSPEGEKAAPAPAKEQAEQAKVQAELFDCRREFVAVLKGINGRETADAAAPKVKELCGKLRECEEKHFKLIQELPENEGLEEAFDTMARRPDSDTNYALGTLAQNGYYGSAALREAMIPIAGDPKKEEEAAAIQLTAEEQALYARLQASSRELIDTMKRVIEVLWTVNSKESADAAAPKVKADLERIFAIEKSLNIDNMPDSIAIKLKAEFRFTLGGFMSSMLINASCLEENQYYGSDALMKAMRRLMIGGEEEPAESPAA